MRNAVCLYFCDFFCAAIFLKSGFELHAPGLMFWRLVTAMVTTRPMTGFLQFRVLLEHLAVFFGKHSLSLPAQPSVSL